MRRICPTIAAFADAGRGAQAKEWGRLLKAGKGKEMNYFLETPGRTTILPCETCIWLLTSIIKR